MAQVVFHRGIHVLAERQQEEIGIDEFEGGVGGGQSAVEMGGFADPAVLEGSDEAQVRVFIKKRQGGEPRVLKNGDKRFVGSGLEDLIESHDGHQRSAQRVGDDREIRGFAALAQEIQQGRVLAGDGDGGSDHLAACGGIGDDPP